MCREIVKDCQGQVCSEIFPVSLSKLVFSNYALQTNGG